LGSVGTLRLLAAVGGGGGRRCVAVEVVCAREVLYCVEPRFGEC